MTHYDNQKNQFNRRNPKGGKPGFKRRLAEVEKNYSIIEVAQKLGIRVSDANKCNCISPSHQDNNYSMLLDKDTNEFRCYVCGAKGTNVIMVRWILEVTPQRAMDYITGRIDYPTELRKEYKRIKPVHNRDDDDFEQPVIHLTAQVLRKIDSSIKPDHHKSEPNKSAKTIQPHKHDPQKRPQKQHTKQDGNRKPGAELPRPQDTQPPQPKYEKPQSPPPQAPSPISMRRKKLFETGELYRIYKFFYNNVESLSKLNFRLAFIADLGISLNTLDQMNVGYIADYHKVDAQLRHRFNVDDLVAAGIFGPLVDETGEQKTGLSFYHHKILFPFYSGKQVSFIQGRRINNEEPIYLNTSKHVGLLYNFNQLRNIKKDEPLIITEGILPTLAMIERGYRSVGLVGLDSWKKEWVDLIRPATVCLVFENTDQGKYLTRRLGNYFSKAGIKPQVALLDKVISSSKKKNIFQEYSAWQEEQYPNANASPSENDNKPTSMDDYIK